MARPAPTHRELGTDRPVHAGQWHRYGDRPEGPPNCFGFEPYFRLTAPIPPPVVRRFSTALIGQRTDIVQCDALPHAEVDVTAFTRNCTTLMRDHGWLTDEGFGPGVGYVLCPGSWVVTFPDGHRIAELPGWFEQRYQPI